MSADRELFLGVLGVQAGFVTAGQVASASASGPGADGRSLLARLEESGALDGKRRELLETIADEALAGAKGDARRALRLLGGEHGLPGGRGDAEREIPPEREGQYTRLEELGRGGQSVVRRAIDELMGREVALKELLGRPPAPGSMATGSTASVARFLREARLTAQLDHPGIVAVHDLARKPDGTFLCAQKLVRGETLKARLARCRSLDERLGLLMNLIDACQAVGYAHSRGVIHRDLKPSNIMVGGFGETVVVDWGLAKRRGEDGEEPEPEQPASGSSEPAVTVAGDALGTPAYMSPEQARGAAFAIDERSDVFSLGVILYQLLTGGPPFAGETGEQVIAQVLKGRFAPVRSACPDAPAELAAVAERALSGDPAERYPGADALAKELLAYRGGGRVSAYEYRSWELVKKFVARNRALTAVAAAAVVVLLGSAVAIGGQLRRAHLQLAQSFRERARAAEASSDWGRAAGYYAASRSEDDSREARWGLALARDKMPRRVLARTGRDRSFVDVGYLPDGRELVVGFEAPYVIGREVESGRELWRFRHEERLDRATLVEDGEVRLVSPAAVRFLDGATGRLVGVLPPTDLPCPSEPLASRLRIRLGADGFQQVAVSGDGGAGGGEPRAIPAKLRRSATALTALCSVSPAGDRVALLDNDGRVRVWDVQSFREIASRPAPDASGLLFTAHGLAVLRTRSIEVFGADEGEFFVAMPGQGGNGLMPLGSAGGVVSPDGHLVVVPRLTSNQADVVDLRTRSPIASLAYATGTPRFAVSPDGGRLLVAGLMNGASLSAWEIGPTRKPRVMAGSARTSLLLSDDGSRILTFREEAGRVRGDVHDSEGSLVGVLDLGPEAKSEALSPDGSRVAIYAPETVTVREVATGAPVGQVPCAGCAKLDLSSDGSRLLSNDGKELVLWDVAQGAVLWRETERAGPAGDALSLSRDGLRMAWSQGSTLHVHAADGGADGEIQLDARIDFASFSHDGRRIAAVSRRSLGVWEVGTLRPVFRVPNTEAVYQEIRWSVDDTTLVHWRDSLGTALLDSRTGERFASLSVSKPAAVGANEQVSLALEARIARGDDAWEIRPLPRPDDVPPAHSLARILEATGLEMRGVELVYPGPDEAR